jgi:hypothetical protein
MFSEIVVVRLGSHTHRVGYIRRQLFALKVVAAFAKDMVLNLAIEVGKWRDALAIVIIVERGVVLLSGWAGVDTDINAWIRMGMLETRQVWAGAYLTDQLGPALGPPKRHLRGRGDREDTSALRES